MPRPSTQTIPLPLPTSQSPGLALGSFSPHYPGLSVSLVEPVGRPVPPHSVVQACSPAQGGGLSSQAPTGVDGSGMEKWIPRLASLPFPVGASLLWPGSRVPQPCPQDHVDLCAQRAERPQAAEETSRVNGREGCASTHAALVTHHAAFCTRGAWTPAFSWRTWGSLERKTGAGGAVGRRCPGHAGGPVFRSSV